MNKVLDGSVDQLLYLHAYTAPLQNTVRNEGSFLRLTTGCKKQANMKEKGSIGSSCVDNYPYVIAAHS